MISLVLDEAVEIVGIVRTMTLENFKSKPSTRQGDACHVHVPKLSYKRTKLLFIHKYNRK